MQRWTGEVEGPAKDEGYSDEEGSHLQAGDGECAPG